MNYESPKGSMKEEERKLIIAMPIMESEKNATLNWWKSFLR